MKEKKIRRIQGALLLTGVLFICMGLWRQEAATVLEKAVNICLECIGIG